MTEVFEEALIVVWLLITKLLRNIKKKAGYHYNVMPLYNLDRAVTVSRFLKLEVNRRDELQQIVKLAAEICNTQMALITLVDEQMQYIQFQTGFEDGVKVLNDEFCQYTILSDCKSSAKSGHL